MYGLLRAAHPFIDIEPLCVNAGFRMGTMTWPLRCDAVRLSDNAQMFWISKRDPAVEKSVVNLAVHSLALTAGITRAVKIAHARSV